MENNSLTPSPMPTPDPGTSMPEFAAAPVQPAQPLPPASAMPDFGNQQQTTPMPMPAMEQPAEPVAEAQPAAPEVVPAAPVVQEPVVEAPAVQPAEQAADPIESQLGEIMEAGAPAEPAAPAEPSVPAETPAPAEVTPSVADLAQNTQPTTPAATPAPEKKPLNTKMIALIGAGALLLVGCIVAAVLLLNQPKPKSQPTENPITTANSGPDTSVDFDKLTSDQALEFLNALDGDTTYYPDGYADEDALAAITDKNMAMFYSYEKESEILNIVKESDFAAKFKDKLTKDTVTITQNEGYAIIEVDADATKCGNACTGVIFDKKVVNFYSEPYTDVLTGIKSQIVHIMLIDHKKADVEKVAPLIASVFMNKQKIYSTELKETNGEFDYIVNTLSYSGAKKDKATATKTHFKVIATGEFLYMPNLTETAEVK